ncbi:MAG TPA: hypothetical protein VKE51_18820 [Vicinamibacterales bacterium]|nr:hypothetical protein [Vicinamibacterales bacterium]
MNAAGIGDVGRPESVDGGRQGRTRDLKPANVFLVRSGAASAPPVAKLLDFGLAKSAAPVVATSGLSMLPTTPPNPTAQGTILGTFQYMAPEQIEGLEADARTDIFALGALLFEMLIGRTAFEGKTRASLLGAILKDEPPRVSALQPVAPPTETTRRPTTQLWTILSRVQPRAAHAALDDAVPAARCTVSSRPYPRRLPALEYPGHMEIRRVSAIGQISRRGALVFISDSLAGEDVAFAERNPQTSVTYVAGLICYRCLRTFKGRPEARPLRSSRWSRAE